MISELTQAAKAMPLGDLDAAIEQVVMVLSGLRTGDGAEAPEGIDAFFDKHKPGWNTQG